jgi:hypothetical protein
MSWFWDNRTWLFSGLGVVLLLGALRWMRAFFRPRPTAQPSNLAISSSFLVGSPVATGSNITQSVSITVPEGSQGTGEFHSDPSADEITGYISSLPPYQQSQACANYEGLRVSWPTVLKSVSPEDDRSARVLMHYGEGGLNSSSVFITVDVSKYPRLKISHRGTKLQVTGTIDEANDHWVKLKDATLSFRQ